MRIGIIFGGNSNEHEVSIVSATSVIKNINKEKYEIYPIYLDKENKFYEVKDEIKEIYEIGRYPKNLIEISNIIEYLQKLDKILPILHGAYGEDGKIQGFLDLIGIPYIGCNVLTSSICMDKSFTKRLLKEANINVTKDILLKKENNKYYYLDSDYNIKEVTIEEINNLITKKLNYPIFIKPCNSGSSVGTNKVDNYKYLEKALNEAFKVDNKILIEECIIGKELECAILNGKATNVGEVKANGEFYTYDSKYKDSKSYTVIPAEIDENIKQEIMNISERAFRVIDGKDLSRIDFFLEDKTNKIILNEINTMPGWTEISMYPKLVMSTGITYEELIEELLK